MIESIRNRSRICKEILLIFSAFFLPGMLFADPSADPSAFERLFWHAGILISALPQIGLLLYVLRLDPQHDPADYGLRPLRSADVAKAGLITLVILASLVLAAIPIALMPGASNLVSSDFRWQFSRPELLPLVIITSVAIGYREELFFRSYLLTRLNEIGVPRSAAIVASTLLFAAGHVYQGVTGFMLAAVIGLVLSIVFLRSRNLHAIAIAHGLYNAFALVGGSFLRDLLLNQEIVLMTTHSIRGIPI